MIDDPQAEKMVMRLVTLASLILTVLVSNLVRAGSYPAGAATQLFSYADDTLDLKDGTTIGSDQVEESQLAGVFSGALRLTDQRFTNTIGSFRLPDLDAGNVIKSFDLRCSFTLASGAPLNAGEGWSVNFGALPDDNGTGEGGFAPLPKGLTVAFRIRNTAEESSSISVLVGDVEIASYAWSPIFTPASRALTLHWDSQGLDLAFDNKQWAADLAVPGFSPGVGDRFAFSARNTDATATVALDNLRVTTEALPVLNTSGPIISEFVANNSEFEDEFADKPGWIELFNGSADTRDLSGWFLTDSKKNLQKWRIEELTLTPYNYQVVFASGRDRQLSSTSFLHANFGLAKGGGYVALVRPDGTVASSYEYGQQAKNVSFGEQGEARLKGYMYPASPGTVNSTAPARFSLSPEVRFSHASGFITEPITLVLSTEALPGAEIRYTTNRTEPGPNSLLYTGPIAISQLSTIRARCYAPDYLPGPVASRTFVGMDATLSNYAGCGKVFESNLPIIYLDSFGLNVDGSTGGSRPFRPTFALVISPDRSTARATLTNAADYAGPAGTHVRGESSAGFGQLSYALELWDENNKDEDASLAGMPADSDWVLYGPWSEKTLMRNKLVFDWMQALRGEDGTAVRTRWVEVFFNQSKLSSGKVGFSSYRGIYVLMEKLKRGSDRVPLENLNAKTVDPELITGGYIIRKDKPDNLKTRWTTSRYGVDLQSFDPDQLNPAQSTYLRGYLADFETSLAGTGLKDFTSGYQAYIDPDTFIDAQWMLEISKQVDGYNFSTYWHKDRGGRLRAGPLWDFNIALGNADYGSGDTPTGWLYNNSTGNGQIWYPRLHTDPDYKLAHWDRYWEMRRSIFSTQAVMAKIQENMRVLLDGYEGLISNRAPASIQNPVARHFRRWPRLGSRDWPNPPAETSLRTWQAEVGYMTNWLNTRLNWLDDQSLRSGKTVIRPPVFSAQQAPDTDGVVLSLEPYQRDDPTLTFRGGQIYYTLDRSDPRLPGGAINPTAIRYSGPITLRAPVAVRARLYAPPLWSPLAVTLPMKAEPASASNLVISEIMYEPAPLRSAETNVRLANPQGCEFVELRNISARAIDLTGVKFTKGIVFDFTFVSASARLLQPGESAVIVADARAFRVRYPHISPAKILGQFRHHLDNGGETLALTAADGSPITEFQYDGASPWPFSGEVGHSIILRNPSLNPNPGDARNWALSAKVDGTPGESGLGADVFSGNPEADQDQDGLSDLFEFATGSDPENPASQFPPGMEIVPLAGTDGRVHRYVRFTYRRQPSAQKVRLTIERSADLQVWVENPDQWEREKATTNSDGTVTETYRGATPIPEVGSAFFRLKPVQLP